MKIEFINSQLKNNFSSRNDANAHNDIQSEENQSTGGENKKRIGGIEDIIEAIDLIDFTAGLNNELSTHYKREKHLKLHFKYFVDDYINKLGGDKNTIWTK